MFVFTHFLFAPFYDVPHTLTSFYEILNFELWKIFISDSGMRKSLSFLNLTFKIQHSKFVVRICSYRLHKCLELKHSGKRLTAVIGNADAWNAAFSAYGF